MGHGTVPDLAIGRVLTKQKGVDHRVLKMRAPPPRHKRIGVALPALRLQKWGCDCGQSALHVDDRAVLIEHAGFDAGLDCFVTHSEFTPNHSRDRAISGSSYSCID